MNPLSTDIAARAAQLEEKIAQAYQVIGALIEDDTPSAKRLLDYFGREVFDPNFLPWAADDVVKR